MSFVGQPRMYSYDNWNAWPENTCGQAAIATILDFFGKDPFLLPRVAAGRGIADDQRLHFDNDAFVGAITRLFPPTTLQIPVIGTIAFTVWETLRDAFIHYRLRVEPRFPPANADGRSSREELLDWLARERLPLITLLDMPELGFPVPPYTLHWGVIHAADADSVWMASWHQGYKFSWETFLRGWHCHGLPHPNNYFCLRVSDH